MSTISTPAEMLAKLNDIHIRSQQRAAQLSQEPLSWTAIGFRVGENHLLSPLHDTQEILTIPKQITPVPNAKPWVYGMANLRGEFLPLVDLKYFLTGQATKINKLSPVVIAKHAEHYSGLLLEEVFGLKHFSSEPKNQGDAAQTSPDKTISPYITADVYHQNIQWQVFNFTKLFSDHRFFNVAL